MRNNKSDNKLTNQTGFTIVELMIATVIFSMVLLVCSYAIIHAGRMYYKGMIMSKTQDTARKIIDSASDAIKYDKSLNIVKRDIGGDPSSICIGSLRYTFSKNKRLGQSGVEHVLWRDNISDSTCPHADINNPNPNPSSLGTEMLGEGMRLVKFDIYQPPTSSFWVVDVRVSSGDDNDFVSEDLSATPKVEKFSLCKGINAGGQFCAVSSYSTTVKNRL